MAPSMLKLAILASSFDADQKVPVLGSAGPFDFDERPIQLC